MSDNAKSAEKKSFTDKLGTAAAVVGGVIAAAAVIPQDELAKKGLPAAWDALKGILADGWYRLEEGAKKFRPVAFAWVGKVWSLLVWWALISLAFVLGGIQVKTSYGSNVGHVLVAAGTVSFAALGIVAFALADSIAAILCVKLKVAGSIFAKAASIVRIESPVHVTEEELAKYRGKVRLVLAGVTVLCFSMLFTMFFPAWSTLGWVLCFWAMVGVALCAALYLDMQMGKAIKAVFYVTIGLIVGMFVIFVLDRLTGGALGFDGFRTWLRAINASELFVAILVLIPAGLLLMGVFSKDKDRKSAFKESAKYVGIGCAILGAFLLYKGTISWKQLSGNEPPKVLTKTADKAESAYLNALDGRSKSNAAPQGTSNYGANHLAPPQMDAIVAPPDETANAAARARTKKPQAKKPPLPPLKAKSYKDAASAVDDLESLL